MKVTLLIAFSFLLFIITSCLPPNTATFPPAKPKPKPDTLPPSTQEGKNTFGCMLNGKVWLPGGATFPSVNMDAQYYKGLFLLSAKKRNSNTQWISMSHRFIYGIGKYYYKTAPASGGAPGAIYSDGSSSCSYLSTDKDSILNWVNITRLDSINYIVSGTFSLRFIATGCDTINITNGRFDMKYTY